MHGTMDCTIEVHNGDHILVVGTVLIFPKTMSPIMHRRFADTETASQLTHRRLLIALDGSHELWTQSRPATRRGLGCVNELMPCESCLAANPFERQPLRVSFASDLACGVIHTSLQSRIDMVTNPTTVAILGP